MEGGPQISEELLIQTTSRLASTAQGYRNAKMKGQMKCHCHLERAAALWLNQRIGIFIWLHNLKLQIIWIFCLQLGLLCRKSQQTIKRNQVVVHTGSAVHLEILFIYIEVSHFSTSGPEHWWLLRNEPMWRSDRWISVYVEDKCDLGLMSRYSRQWFLMSCFIFGKTNWRTATVHPSIHLFTAA